MLSLKPAIEYTHDPAVLRIDHGNEAIKRRRRAFEDAFLVAFHLQCIVHSQNAAHARPYIPSTLTLSCSQFGQPSLLNSEGVWTSEHSRQARSFLVWLAIVDVSQLQSWLLPLAVLAGWGKIELDGVELKAKEPAFILANLEDCRTQASVQQECEDISSIRCMDWPESYSANTTQHSATRDAMVGLLSIIRKAKRKERSMRILMVYVD